VKFAKETIYGDCDMQGNKIHRETTYLGIGELNRENS